MTMVVCRRNTTISLLLVFLATLLNSENVVVAFWNSGGSGSNEVLEGEPPKDSPAISDADDKTTNHGFATPNGSPTTEYGVDVSFPMQHANVSENYAWLPHNIDSSTVKTPKEFENTVVQPLGNRQAFYDDFINGCREAFEGKGDRCGANERDRIAMTLRQPQSMQNYTDVGYKKIKTPPAVWKLIKSFWDSNGQKQKIETWGAGNTYTNNWASPTYMTSVEDNNLRGGGYGLKRKIWDAAKNTLQEWTGEELTECSLYGIRVYKEGAILAPHVDRLPLVSSAIVHVASDIDEDWPLEVVGHDGVAHNVSMKPGDMVLYESHSVIHGRPFPMKGRFYANIFIHFEPVGHSLRHNARITEEEKTHVDEKYKDATARGQAGHETTVNDDGLPSYIIRGTPEEDHWRRAHPNMKRSAKRSFATGSTYDVNRAAQKGDLNEVTNQVKKNGKNVVNHKDENGWTPLHEAARGGHEEIVKYLFENGANLNERTNEGLGGTPLYWSTTKFGKDHPVTQYLESVGALNIGPEL